MNFGAIAWAFERVDVTPIQKLILIKLADAADANGVASVSENQLAAWACCSKRAAGDALRALEKRGLLEVESPYPGATLLKRLPIELPPRWEEAREKFASAPGLKQPDSATLAAYDRLIQRAKEVRQ